MEISKTLSFARQKRVLTGLQVLPMTLCLPVIFRRHFWNKNYKRRPLCEPKRPASQYFKVLRPSRNSMREAITSTPALSSSFTIAAMTIWSSAQNLDSTEFTLMETLKLSLLKMETVEASLRPSSLSSLLTRARYGVPMLGESTLFCSSPNKKSLLVQTRSVAAKVKTTHSLDALQKLKTWIKRVWIR